MASRDAARASRRQSKVSTLPPPLTPGVLAAASRVRQLASCLMDPVTLRVDDWQRIFLSERSRAVSSIVTSREGSDNGEEVAAAASGASEGAGTRLDAAGTARTSEMGGQSGVFGETQEVDKPVEDGPSAPMPVVPDDSMDVQVDTSGRPLLRDRAGAPELCVPPSTAVLNALRAVGARIESAVSVMLAEVESQMLLVFQQHRQLRAKYEEEEQVLRRHRWEGEEESRGSPPKIAPSTSPAFRRDPPPLSPLSDEGAAPAPALLHSPRSMQRSKTCRATGGNQVTCSGQQALLAHLHLVLATARSACSASKAYLYLYEDDGAGCLRCVSVAGDGADPSDLSIAAGGVAATVYQTGVALSVTNAAGADLRHVLAVPILGSATDPGKGGRRGAQGVVALHAKIHGTEGFTPQDEAELAGLSRHVRALLKLYPSSVTFRRRFDPGPLRRLALPSVGPSADTDMSTAFDPAAVDASRYGDQLVLRLRSTQQLGRAQADDIAAPAAARDPSASASHHTISQCARLKETARYIANLEQMWRNCIDEKAGMQQHVLNWQKRTQAKDTELTVVHSALKEMTGQVQQLKADNQRLRKAAAGQTDRRSSFAFRRRGSGYDVGNMPPGGGLDSAQNRGRRKSAGGRSSFCEVGTSTLAIAKMTVSAPTSSLPPLASHPGPSSGLNSSFKVSRRPSAVFVPAPPDGGGGGSGSFRPS